MNYNKWSKIIFRFAGIMLIIFLFSSFLMSGLLARYISSASASDDARVAYWDVESIERDGTKVTYNKGINTLASEDSGNWFFQINNKSEVAAIVDGLSSVSLTVSSTSFKSTDVMESWDFLKDNGVVINNPITFKVSIYDCKCEELDQYLVYTKGTSKLNKIQYDALSDTEKKGYVEDVVLPNDSNISEYVILNTDESLSFTRTIEYGRVYFTTDKTLSSNDIELAIGTGSCTVRVKWSVGLNTASGDTIKNSFNAFYVIERSEYNTTNYTGLVEYDNSTKVAKLTKGVAVNQITNTTKGRYFFEVNVEENDVNVNKEYVIAYKEYDYFDYLIYVSSLGGEPTFTELNYEFLKVETRSSGIYKRSYNIVPESEKDIIRTRTLIDVDTTNTNATTSITYDTIKKYFEKLQLDEYEAFILAQNEFQNSVGYLGIGLNCNIVLDIKVSQVD